MVTAGMFKKVFAAKLLATGDMDEAFKKAVWVAFNEGVMEGMRVKNPDIVRPKVEVILKKAYGEQNE